MSSNGKQNAATKHSPNTVAVSKNQRKRPRDHGGDESTFERKREPTFPVILHAILSNSEYQDIITWLPHGRSWRILQQEVFKSTVLPVHFRHGRYSSFTRQVNGWGFRRVTQGDDYNSYYHELFLRGRPHLCKQMKRLTQHDTSRKGNDQDQSPSEVPDFYALSREDPLPITNNENAEGKSNRHLDRTNPEKPSEPDEESDRRKSARGDHKVGAATVERIAGSDRERGTLRNLQETPNAGPLGAATRDRNIFHDDVLSLSLTQSLLDPYSLGTNRYMELQEGIAGHTPDIGERIMLLRDHQIRLLQLELLDLEEQRSLVLMKLSRIAALTEGSTGPRGANALPVSRAAAPRERADHISSTDLVLPTEQIMAQSHLLRWPEMLAMSGSSLPPRSRATDLLSYSLGSQSGLPTPAGSLIASRAPPRGALVGTSSIQNRPDAKSMATGPPQPRVDTVLYSNDRRSLLQSSLEE